MSRIYHAEGARPLRHAFVAGGALLVLALTFTLAVSSAFTDTTESNNNFFESGTLSISDDNPDSSALFEVTNVNDNASGAKCITVENDGTIDYTALQLTRSAGTEVQASPAPADAATNPGLGEDVTFTVTALDNEVATTGGSCAAFDAAVAGGATPRPVAIGGAAKDAATTTDELSALRESGEAGPGEKTSYRIAYAVDMGNTDMGQRVEAISFSWDASQGS